MCLSLTDLGWLQLYSSVLGKAVPTFWLGLSRLSVNVFSSMYRHSQSQWLCNYNGTPRLTKEVNVFLLRLHGSFISLMFFLFYGTHSQRYQSHIPLCETGFQYLRYHNQVYWQGKNIIACRRHSI